MTRRREPDGKISAYNEVKGEALNLKRALGEMRKAVLELAE